MSGAGAFMQGLAGGVSTGRSIKDRQKITDAWDRMSKQRPPEQGGSYGSQQGTDFNPNAAGGGAPGQAGGGRQPIVGYTGDDRITLAKTLQAEAGGEGYEGMLAAGSVINNRAQSGKYGGNNLRDVIMKPGQFSAWNSVTGYAGGEGGLDMLNMQPSAEAMRATDALLSGSYEDPTGGATHYYNPAVATPKWGKQAGGNWQTIGNHVFGNADGRRGAGNDAPQQQQVAAAAAEEKKDLPFAQSIARSVFGEESPADRILRSFYKKGD